MQTILHELEHAYQHKISIDPNINTLHSVISKICFYPREFDNDLAEQISNKIRRLDIILENDLYNQKKEELDRVWKRRSKITELVDSYYQKEHDIFPIERAAEINSYKCIKDFLEDTDYQNLYYFFYFYFIIIFFYSFNFCIKF